MKAQFQIIRLSQVLANIKMTMAITIKVATRMGSPMDRGGGLIYLRETIVRGNGSRESGLAMLGISIRMGYYRISKHTMRLIGLK